MVKSKEETAYLLQTCGDNFVIREFRADVKYDMVAYTKPVYNWRELRRYVFDKDLNEKKILLGLLSWDRREQMDPWVIEYIQPLLLGKLGI